MTQQTYTPVSLHPDDMVAGGALPTGNILVVKSRFGHYVYPNGGQVTFALIWNLVNDAGETFEQAYSAGDKNKWAPSAESTPGAGDMGRFAIPMSGDTGLNNNTNASFLMKELINAGYPEEVVREGDAMRFDNLYALFEAKAQPKRTGGTIQQREGAQSAVPVTIHNLPWEASKRGTLTAIAPTAPTAPVGAPAPAPAVPVASNGPAPAAAPVPAAAMAPVATAPAAAPAVGPATPAASPPGGPDVPTLQKVCLDAINAVLAQANPSGHAMVAAHIMQAHAADPQVNAYANYLFTPEMLAYAATQGINTENGNFQKA